MDNFEVLNHYSIPSDILMDMLSTYKLLGKSDAYKNQLLEQESYIQNEVLEKDTFYAIKLFTKKQTRRSCNWFEKSLCSFTL